MNRRGLRGALVALLAMGVWPEATARAEPGEPTLRDVAEGTVDRARRAVSIGPSAGGSLAIGLPDGELDGAISFGLGLYLHDVPVAPTPASLRALVEARVRERVEEKVRGMIERGEPAPGKEDLERLAREITDEVRREVQSYATVQPRTLERPRMAFDLEGGYLVRSEAWQVRASAGIGIKWVSLGPTVAVHLGDDKALLVGPAIDLR
ncbi:MAG TPA: hypothetical protein VKZ63_06485, partial [Kofleriaceae bacterium]|nr:hypothetical protein [Kofleriaceae bacterium]